MTSGGLISIDTAYSSALPDVTLCSPETAPFWFEPDKPLKLRVFIDKRICAEWRAVEGCPQTKQRERAGSSWPQIAQSNAD